MKNKDVFVSKVSIAAIALLTIGAIYLISSLKFDYDFEDFFPKNDPETDFYQDFRKAFETDNDFFIVAIDHEKSIFDAEFLKQIDLSLIHI